MIGCFPSGSLRDAASSLLSGESLIGPKRVKSACLSLRLRICLDGKGCNARDYILSIQSPLEGEQPHLWVSKLYLVKCGGIRLLGISDPKLVAQRFHSLRCRLHAKKRSDFLLNLLPSQFLTIPLVGNDFRGHRRINQDRVQCHL